MTPNPNIKVEYFAGLDLGQPHEFTGLAVLERTTRHENGHRSWSRGSYAIRHLERFTLGTPSPEICQRLKDVFSVARLAHSKLTVEQSAVGKPVLEMLKQAKINAELRSLIVTGGHTVSYSDGAWLVPKQELVSAVQVLLQTRRLRFAPTLPEAQTFIQELLNYKMKVTLSTTDSLAAWREGPNDDLVLAVAVAGWSAERCPPHETFVPYVLCGSPSWHR